jgi:hypothetical protein
MTVMLIYAEPYIYPKIMIVTNLILWAKSIFEISNGRQYWLVGLFLNKFEIYFGFLDKDAAA